MEPMLCYGCGKPISPLWEVFNILRQELMRVEDKSEATPEMRMSDMTPMPALEPIFKILRLSKKRYCCRKQIMSIRTIDDM